MHGTTEVIRQQGDGIFKRGLKILYIQPGTTTFAGIERVNDTICSALVARNGEEFDVDVLYVSQHKDRPPGERKYNTIERISHGRQDLMRNMRSVISAGRYDLVVIPQIEATVICMAACLGLRQNFAMHLHGNPRLERSHFKAKVLFFLMKVYFLKRLSGVYGTSPKQLQSFKAMFDSKVPDWWLPNPVRKFDIERSKPAEDDGIITFINVGRYSFQKGQDVLLEAFSLLHKARKNVRLKIVGHGPDEEKLKAAIARLDLKSVVSLEYYPENPQKALAESDIFVSTSRWEGWSLAICEALRFGLPMISTDCEFGPSDILVDKRLGMLVPVNDVEKLTCAMNYYCDNLQEQLSHSEYRQDYIDRFSVEQVVNQHAEAIKIAAKGRQS